MALFVFWNDTAVKGRPAAALLPLIERSAHIVPEWRTSGHSDTPSGRWNHMVFATRTHFYAPESQYWQAEGQGSCVIHGLIWRARGHATELLDARAVARLLDRPGAELPADVGGEYAVLRLHADGTLEAFSDKPGLHQIFRGVLGEAVVANRASLVATVLDDHTPDMNGLRWLPTIGYRVGTATAYRSVTQVGQGKRVRIDGAHATETAMADPIVRLGGPRGWSSALDAELDLGIAQARAAIRLAVPADGAVDLPITGGKDSRVVLALCLAEGLRDRLRLFTRGYSGHPDVIAGAGIATALGLLHRRDAPHGSDAAAHWPRDRFFDTLMAQAWQSDAMVGGWDLILGKRIGTETLISGHMGEVLKAYSKKAVPPGRLDPAAMVRLQAPFDPMDMLRPDARAGLVATLADQMDVARDEGAGEADLPDLFYYRNRVPNWLGAIRSIKSFERQPVVPLGVPALLRLAFRLTPEERRSELLHHRIIARTAPELLPLPFAHQSWDAALGEDVPRPDPILPGAGAPPAFGNWQFSFNHNARIRATLAAEVRRRPDLALWDVVDRERLIERLHNRRLDYFDGISMLGLVVAMFQESALLRPQRMGADPVGGAGPQLAVAADPVIAAHLDGSAVRGDTLVFGGWAFIPEWPAAQPAIELRLGGEAVAITAASNDRPDLVAHGMGDGRHGFHIEISRARLAERADESGEVEVTLDAFDGTQEIARVKVKP